MTATDQNAGYVIAPLPQPSLPVRGTDRRFPVHRIYCVGRNYAAHAIEMGHDPDAEPPFFFLKSADTLVTDGADFPYPAQTREVHHEIELVLALGRGGRDIAIADAMGCVFGHAVGLDMTRRDLQAEAKRLGRPWDVAKGFDYSAPCGEIVPASMIATPGRGAIRLAVNDALRQEATLEHMIWKIPEIIAHLSRLWELRAGDLIMTGTPAGVGPVQRGDRLHGQIEGVGTLRLKVV
jgi:fumarylpyruvate hydrolase